MDQHTEELLRELDNRIDSLIRNKPTDTDLIFSLVKMRVKVAGQDVQVSVCTMEGGCVHPLWCQKQGFCEYPDTI